MITGQMMFRNKQKLHKVYEKIIGLYKKVKKNHISNSQDKLPITVDIEVTNHCNTNCIFCPRQAIGKKGYMDFKTFKKAVDRLLEVKPLPATNICGLGEPLMHPEIVEFVDSFWEESIEDGEQ